MRATALLPLVGRNDALADAERVLDAARESHGGLLLVTGEAGIGKTRLAEEVAARAQGFTSVWSWCASDRAAGSFRPWVQVVHELAAGYAPVARLVTDSPYLGGLLSHDVLVGDPLADTEVVRTLFVDAVAAVVRSAAAHRPLLVILDDLHAAQESSLWLLAHLVPTLRSTAAVVLATARDGERDWHGHIEARAALVRQASSLRLSPLSATHVAELVRHVAGAPPPAHLPPRLAARTGGNPFLIAELVRLLRDRQLDAARPAAGRGRARRRRAGVGARHRRRTHGRLQPCLSAAPERRGHPRHPLPAGRAGRRHPHITG
jgi:predicted ATPase